ncbi:urease accessory protein [Rubrivivax gelatinosus]|nr:urease accessory protein [Rubrivivax gelatinosus]
MGWHGHLRIDYRLDGERSIALDRHHGPLRVLQRLYPEGPGICHHVLVHPPGGIVGGDVLEVEATLAAGSHALLTTPGATRFYRSAGERALQRVAFDLAAGARLEWLPMETIAHRGCLADNRLRLRLAPGAEAIGWDILALGLPAAGEAFDAGNYSQRVELDGVWLDAGVVDGADTVLLDGPCGFAGHRVLATMWCAAGGAGIAAARRTALLEAAREVIDADALGATAGVTSPHPPVLVLRVLADRVEPAMALLVKLRAAWRRLLWGLEPNPPRIWRT